ncbi:phage replication initiation protein, NGO0469 family [Neisseria gonorrhoeae]
MATDLKSWRGRDFTPEERDNFDLRNILGKPCLLSIAHQESSDGKTTYANISAISNKMKSYTPKHPDNAVFAFDLSDPDWANYGLLNEKLREQIAKSPEYAEAVNGRQPRRCRRNRPKRRKGGGTPPRQCRACRRHRGRHPF